MSGVINDTGIVRRARGDRGFTVLEMLAVLFIVVIAAGLAVPAVRTMMTSSSLRAGATQIGDALLRARNLAITSGKLHCLRIVPSPDQDGRDEAQIIQLPGMPVDNPPAATWDAWIVADRDRGGETLPPQVSARFTDSSQYYILFLPDGSAWRYGMIPSSTITVYLREDYSQTSKDTATYDDNERRIISIGSLTGRITVGRRVE